MIARADPPTRRHAAPTIARTAAAARPAAPRPPFDDFARDWGRQVAADIMASPAVIESDLYDLARLAYDAGASLDRIERLLSNVLLEAF